MATLSQLVQRLCDAEVDFVIVGGYAALLHGSTLVTRFDRVRSASLEIELFGRTCRVISLEDLIQAKEALGRDKDLLAVKELRAIRKKLQAASTPDAPKP